MLPLGGMGAFNLFSMSFKQPELEATAHVGVGDSEVSGIRELIRELKENAQGE